MTSLLIQLSHPDRIEVGRSPGAAGSMSGWLFEELCRQIITGELSPNSRVTEEMLATSLDVSRTPLRDALRQLEEIGLIVRQRNRSVRVAPLCLEEVVEMTQIRERLEGLVASAATERVGEGEVSTERLRVIVAEYDRAKRTENPGSLYLQLGRLFHAELATMSGLNRASKMLTSIHLSLARYRHILATDSARVEARAAEHQRILDCIERGDPNAAEDEMRRHIREGLSVFTAKVEEFLSEQEGN